MFNFKVDDYEPIVEEDLSTLYPTGADVYLENIKYIVLGNGQATSDSKFNCLHLLTRFISPGLSKGRV